MDKIVVLILLCLNFLVSGCAAGRKMLAGKVIDAPRFEKVKKVAIVSGITNHRHEQEIFLECFEKRLSETKFYEIIGYQKTEDLMSESFSEPELPTKIVILAEVPEYKDFDPLLAKKIGEKTGADAFFVVWAFRWVGSEYVGALGAALLGGGEEQVERWFVSQLFSTEDGKELWHGDLHINEKRMRKVSLGSKDKRLRLEIDEYARRLLQRLTFSKESK